MTEKWQHQQKMARRGCLAAGESWRIWHGGWRSYLRIWLNNGNNGAIGVMAAAIIAAVNAA